MRRFRKLLLFFLLFFLFNFPQGNSFSNSKQVEWSKTNTDDSDECQQFWQTILESLESVFINLEDRDQSYEPDLDATLRKKSDDDDSILGSRLQSFGKPVGLAFGSRRLKDKSE